MRLGLGGEGAFVIRHLSFVMSGEAGSQGFDRWDVYRLSERMADRIWQVVSAWEPFAKDTIGKQLVRAADSVGANIAEGSGRYHYQDNRRFVRIARGSLYETRHWLRRAYARMLLPGAVVEELAEILNELGPRLNIYLRSIGAEGLKEDGPNGEDQPEPSPDDSWPLVFDSGEECDHSRNPSDK
jgi:four helix bundle protein